MAHKKNPEADLPAPASDAQTSPHAPAQHSAEFTRILALGPVSERRRSVKVEASAEECVALAERFRIPAVDSLAATLTLWREKGGAVRVTGTLRAAVVQSCVVSLDPVPQEVAEEVSLRLLPVGEEPADEPDDIEEIATQAGDTVDMGEILAEQLSLALDPYPRAPGAALPEESVEEATARNPFAVLAQKRQPQ